MYIKRSTRFDLYKRNDRKGNIPIRMRVSFNDNRIDILTGYRIDPIYWNKDKEKAKHGFSDKNGYNSNSINNQLNEYRTIINEIFNKFELIEKRIPQKEEFKKQFLQSIGRIKAENTDNIFEVFDKFINEESLLNNWSESTIKKFRTTKKKLFNFDSSLLFESINEKKCRIILFI